MAERQTLADHNWLDALRSLSPTFAAGLARVREVTDQDGALSAAHKALAMAGAAAARGQPATMRRELARAAGLGCPPAWARGAAMALLISRGEDVYQRFLEAVLGVYGPGEAPAASTAPELRVTAQDALDYFERALGSLPPYVELLAASAPRVLEGYFLMRQAAIGDNPLPTRMVELFYITVNAAEYMTWNVGLHVRGARQAGASQAEVVEAAICSIPIGGAPAWIAAAEAIDRQAAS